MPMNTVSPGDLIRSTDHNSIVNAISGGAGETLTVFYKGADITSAAALTIPDTGNYFDVTGTTNITSISSLPAGTVIKLQFDAALTIVHNATTLALSGGANYTTAAGDIFEFISEGSGNWRETSRSLSATTGGLAGTPSLAFGTGNTAGSGSVFVRRNATVALFDTTAARALQFGDVGTAGTVGSAAGGGGFAAARDHGHAMTQVPAVVASVGNYLGVASTNGDLNWLTVGGGTTLVKTKAEATADQGTTSTSFVDLTGLNFTTNTSATNKTRLEFWAPFINDSGSALVTVQILVASTMKQIQALAAPGANYLFGLTLMRDALDQATGSKAVGAQFKVNGGTGTMYLTGAGNSIAQLVHTEYRNLGS